jgi:hypothetical protein
MSQRKHFPLLSGASAFLLAAPVLAQLDPGEVIRKYKISAARTEFDPPLDMLDQYGRAAISPGDIDGDGHADLVVGAIGDDDGGTAGIDSDTGAIWVHFLNPFGSVRETVKISELEGGLVASFRNRDQFGRSLERLGDLDGDGVPDIAVGAARDDDGGLSRGAFYVLFLERDGTVKAQQKVSSVAGGFTGVLDDFDEFGRSIANLGDLDGDGVIELAVGATGDDDGGADWKGAVWVLFMKRDGTVKSHQKISMAEGGFRGALGGGDLFGFAAASLGDLDGDGVVDLAVGTPKDDDGGVRKGAVWILFLKPDGKVKGHQKISDVGNGFGLNPGDEFGSAVAGIGDLDGDGLPDLAVGAILDDGDGHDNGAVWILFLNANGTVKSKQKINDLEGNFFGGIGNDDWFGSATGYLGDLNGDGKGDLAIGARFDDDFVANSGSVYLVFLEGAANVPPVAGFSASLESGLAPLQVSFEERSSAGAKLWSWDFGDGTGSALEDPVHVFTQPGTYTVELEVSGPGGTDTASLQIEVLAAAQAQVRNGGGTNRACFASSGLPVLGTSWTSQVETAVHPGASLTFLVVKPLPLAGVFVSGGELLVAGPRLVLHGAPAGGGLALHSLAIPDDPALIGFPAATQAVILGGGIELCNAIDLVLGH